MKKKSEIIKIDVSVTCFCCGGKGCKKCANGIYKENHYIISDGKNAIDGDTLK